MTATALNPGGVLPAPATPEQDPKPPGAGNAAARDQIDALRAAADLLVLHPVEDPWISVSGTSIQLIPGGAADGRAAAVDCLAAQLGATAQTTRHHGRTWRAASGCLGRYPVNVFAALDEREPGR